MNKSATACIGTRQKTSNEEIVELKKLTILDLETFYNISFKIFINL